MMGPFGRFAQHLCRCHCGRYACAGRREVVGGARLFVRQLQAIKEPAIKERAANPIPIRPYWRSFAGGCERSAAPTS